MAPPRRARRLLLWPGLARARSTLHPSATIPSHRVTTSNEERVTVDDEIRVTV